MLVEPSITLYVCRMKLSRTEEQLMQHLWKLEKAFMKDLINSYDDPKPATTTIATLLKRMFDKGYITYTLQGKFRLYTPIVAKDDYFSRHFRNVINSFFGNSASQFASFFTRTTDLSTEELQALRREIDKAIEKKKKIS